MPIQPAEIKEIFQQIKHLKEGVIGDFALDFYYGINQQSQEFSVETGREVFWVNKPKTPLGAAGNVVQNLAALADENLLVFGCVGDDIYDQEMQCLLQKLKVKTTNLKTIQIGRSSCTYTKQMSINCEENRLDFGTHNALSETVFDEILEAVESALPTLNALIINQQFQNPLLTPQRIQRLNAILS